MINSYDIGMNRSEKYRYIKIHTIANILGDKQKRRQYKFNYLNGKCILYAVSL